MGSITQKAAVVLAGTVIAAGATVGAALPAHASTTAPRPTASSGGPTQHHKAHHKHHAKQRDGFTRAELARCTTTYTENQRVVPCTTRFPKSLFRTDVLVPDSWPIDFEAEVTTHSTHDTYAYVGSTPMTWVGPNQGIITFAEPGLQTGPQILALYDNHGVLVAWDTVTVTQEDYS